MGTELAASAIGGYAFLIACIFGAVQKERYDAGEVGAGGAIARKWGATAVTRKRLYYVVCNLVRYGLGVAAFVVYNQGAQLALAIIYGAIAIGFFAARLCSPHQDVWWSRLSPAVIYAMASVCAGLTVAGVFPDTWAAGFVVVFGTHAAFWTSLVIWPWETPEGHGKGSGSARRN